MGDAGTDTEGLHGEGGLLAYGYESDFKVINNGAKHYPIELHFTGEMPVDESWQNIQEVDFIQQVSFNPVAKEYQ